MPIRGKHGRPVLAASCGDPFEARLRRTRTGVESRYGWWRPRKSGPAAEPLWALVLVLVLVVAHNAFLPLFSLPPSLLGSVLLTFRLRGEGVTGATVTVIRRLHNSGPCLCDCGWPLAAPEPVSMGTEWDTLPIRTRALPAA